MLCFSILSGMNQLVDKCYHSTKIVLLLMAYDVVIMCC